MKGCAADVSARARNKFSRRRCTHTPCRTHIFLTHFPCVTYRHRVHAWLTVFAVRMSYLSVSPSPFSCFIRLPCCSLTVTSRHTFPTLTTAPSLPNCSRSESAGQAHFRTGGGEFGDLPIPRTGDKITSVDDDTMLINDPNLDSISDFSKTTRENTGLFGVPTVFEGSVSHVSHGNVALHSGSQESMPRKTVARQRERGER